MPADTDTLIAAIELPNLRELAARGRVQSYRKDVVIIQEGDYGDTLHIILSGRVKVFATGDNDREVVIDERETEFGRPDAGPLESEPALGPRP